MQTFKSKKFLHKHKKFKIIFANYYNIDEIKRNPKKVKAILKAYTRNISTIASNETIIKNIRGTFPEMASSTFYDYVNALSKLFVIDNVSRWSPNIRSAKSMRATPKKSLLILQLQQLVQD